MTWQPIETAPKDGTTVIVARIAKRQAFDLDLNIFDTNETAVFWCVDARYDIKRSVFVDTDFEYVNATHWMPLPKPPEEFK